MSDQSQGPGWWLASDGRWYPPSDTAAASSAAAPSSAAPAPPVAGADAPPAAGAATAPTWDGSRWVDPSSGQWWDGQGWHAMPTAATGPPPAAPAAPVAPVVPTAAAPAPSKRSAAPLLVVGAIVVVLVLIGAFVLVRSRSGPSLSTDVVADGAVASGPDELPSGDIALTDQTVVVRGNGGATLRSMAADGSTLTLDGSADGVDRLEAGSVLLLTGVTVVKVTDVQRDGGDVVVKTEAAAIGDVIKDGSLSWDEVPTSAASIQVWDAGPDDVEVNDSSMADDGSSGGGDPTADGEEQEGSLGPDLPPTPAGDEAETAASPWEGARHAMAAATAPSGLPAIATPAQADPIDKSGELGDYKYSFKKVSGADGSSHYQVGVTREGNYVLKLDLDAQIDTIISSGDLQVSSSTLDKLHLKSNKFNGTAKLSISAGTGETIAPVKQEILSIPVSINFPIVVYGIPFAITVKGKFLIEPAFTSKNATVSGQAEVTFGGTAGLSYEGGSLSADGAMTQKGENPMEYVSGLGVGVTGIVFASQFPRLGFGLGYGSSNAGVYLANTTSAGITISSAIGMVPCNSISITNTTSAGVEAAFLGIDVPLGDRGKAELSKDTWNYYAPDSEACKSMSGN